MVCIRLGRNKRKLLSKLWKISRAKKLINQTKI
uniref:Uncharacterized protein n=1 Tax=Podoviridae sp. ct8nN1 TaxID=2827296 RepID=A0A8S5R370_9CAUD|nr:MAG TPA: hypothetical protein [Podoviridae sp. ct8nN1]